MNDSRDTRAQHSRLHDEDGIGMVELVSALSLIAIAMMALTGAMSLGFKQVSHGRQRQTATEIGNARIEHLRHLTYASAALSSTPAHNPDPDNPDHYVSADGTKFDVSGAGDWEDLIVDPSAGAVLHLEDPVVVGATTLEIYQYVTWVDDPGISGTQDYRRVTVVVRYKIAEPGVQRFVRISSLFTPGSVTIGGTAGTAQPGSSDGPSPAPSPSPTGTCSGDTAAPTGSFQIESGSGSQTGYTPSTSVTIRMSYNDGCGPIRVRFSNDGATYGEDVVYDPASATVSWALTSGDGTKAVYARVRDGIGNEMTEGPRTIVLDTVPPTVPGSLSRTVACSGLDRTVSLGWGTASDANLSGYRPYRSIDNEPWASLGNVASPAKADTHLKTIDSVRYRAVAYDKAGNESAPTNEVTLAKNQCS